MAVVTTIDNVIVTFQDFSEDPVPFANLVILDYDGKSVARVDSHKVPIASLTAFYRGVEELVRTNQPFFDNAEPLIEQYLHKQE
jgi:hypothetical protein